MAGARKRTTALGRRYAKALLDVAGQQKKDDAWGQELDVLAEVFEGEPLLRHSLTDPLVREARRREVLDAFVEAADPSPPVAALLREMLRQGRLGRIPEVALAYRELLDAKRGIVEVSVATAAPLDDAGRKRLAKALETLTGKQVRLEESVDPDLIGGIVARVGDTVYDASALGRLDQIRAAMAGAAD